MHISLSKYIYICTSTYICNATHYLHQLKCYCDTHSAFLCISLSRTQTLGYTATRFATHCNETQKIFNRSGAPCNTLQHPATRFHDATHYNTLCDTLCNMRCIMHCNMHCNTHYNKLEHRHNSGCCSVCCVCTHAYCRLLQCMLHVTGLVCDTVAQTCTYVCIYIYIYVYLGRNICKTEKKVRGRPREQFISLKKMERESAYVNERFIFMNPNDSSICINTCINIHI